MNELIILPCHSIWKGGDTIGESRDEWYLAPFQFEGQDHLAFKGHIKTSLARLESIKSSYLIISGGQTKKEAGPVSEAHSYFDLTKSLLSDPNLKGRIAIEEFARDSFENVLFSICRFFEIFGRYPLYITVVGFEFKKKRFLENHLKQALGYEDTRLEYIGNEPNPVQLNSTDAEKYYKDLERSEYEFAIKHFEQDWYGAKPPLVTKRETRDPFKRTHAYSESNPQLATFLKLVNSSSYSNEEIKSYLNDVKL